jgi:KDO2-lipid IV(A) lauroyltransferase
MAKSKHHSLNPSDYWQPRYWTTWLGIAGMWLLGNLPFRLQWWLAKLLGTLAYRLAPKRRHIAATNIRLCFPELNPQQQDQRVKAVFFNNSMGFIETCSCWLSSTRRQQRNTVVHGLEHVEKVKDRGILLLGGHYAILDLAGALIAPHLRNLDTVQREHNNPLLNAVQTQSRRRFVDETISRKDMRTVIRNLKQGRIVWYAPDQDYGRKSAVFAPFFGVPTATIVGTARLAKSTGAAVIPISYFREDDGKYHIYLGEALDNFPSGDDVADATRINQIIEHEIRRHPAQYLWLHRRFKTRPEGEASVY